MAAAVAESAGKSADGRARTREVKLACLFTQTTLDEQGRPVRDPDSTSYLGSFAPANQFATLVHAEPRCCGADHIRQLVVLGDGAPWIWKLATAIAPEATPIVDIYHAREHLHALAAALAPALGDQHPDWLTARLADLDAGDIETLVAATTRLALTDDLAHDTEKALANSSRPTPIACAMPTSATTACSSAPAPSKPAAKPSSANASNCPACAGTSPAPPPSSPCAASTPAAAGSRSGHRRTTRPPPRDQVRNKIKSDHLQI